MKTNRKQGGQPVENPRSRIFAIRLTEAERSLVHRAARKMKLRPSDYARTRLLEAR